MADYTKLDRFMAVETWHTNHADDLKRFNSVLYELLKDDDFNPDEMREYMAQTLRIDRNDDEHPFSRELDRLTAAAWSVKEYLDHNGLR